MNKITPIKFEKDILSLLDQRFLPLEEKWIHCHTIEDVHGAIKDMIVRGAPSIGFTAIFGLALWLKENDISSDDKFKDICKYLCSARPTAVNLAYEVNRISEAVLSQKSSSAYQYVVDLGLESLEKSHQINQKMAGHALDEMQQKFQKKKLNILTHCNTGTLACGSLGTALGVIETLSRANMINHVWASETRPYLQGSRLTAYELDKNNIEHSIVVEGAISHLMSLEKVDAVFVGADRIASNGDTANKVGTSNLSVLCNYYDIPFYVVAPTNSFDLSLPSGKEIEIELRDPSEITNYKEYRIAPAGSNAYNPSFDITEGKLITGIISERGISYSQDDHKHLKELNTL